MLTLLATARAFDEPYLYWTAEQRPVVVEWNGAPEGWSEADSFAELEAAAAFWNNAACIGDLLALQPGTVSERYSADQIHSVTFGDARDEIDPDLPGNVYALSSGEEVLVGGQNVFVPFDVDAVFNDIPFASETEIASGACDTTFGLRATAVRLLGNVVGLGRSCDYDYDPCTPAEAAGIMDSTQDTCAPAPEKLATDDLLALHWLYGTPFDFACVAVADDPHGVECHVGGPALSDVTWDLGDGTTTTGESVSHSYGDAGEYLVTTCFTLDSCGESLCLDHVVYAVDGGAVSELPAGSEAEACGCASPGAAALLPLLLLGRRRFMGA